MKPSLFTATFFAAFVTLLALSTSAQAQYAACTSTSGPNTYYQTLNIGRDAQVNQPIGPWITTNLLSWNCYTIANTWPVTLDVTSRTRVYGAYISSGNATFSEGGQTYRLFLVDIGGEQVGYIVRWRSRVDAGAYSDWQPVTQPVSIRQDGVSVAVTRTSSAIYYGADIEVQARMVKTTAASPAANSVFNFTVLQVELVTQNLSGDTANVHIVQSAALNAHFDQVNATCTTPDLTVQLPTVVQTTLPYVGSTGGATNFDLLFQNCPAYLHSITWRAEAPGQVAVTDGTLPLQNTSTAAGVGVQVLYPDDTPLAFYTPHALSDYNPTWQNASYSVPLKARVIRTAASVTAGSLQTSMQIKVTYQ